MHEADVIVTDVRMPKMDGIAFITELRRLGDMTPVIFLSGYTDKEYLLSAIRLGAVDYVEKPVSLDELFASVKRSLELSANRQNLTVAKAQYKAEPPLPEVESLTEEMLSAVSDVMNKGVAKAGDIIVSYIDKFAALSGAALSGALLSGAAVSSMAISDVALPGAALSGTASRENGKFNILVRDDGIGMRSELLSMITKPSNGRYFGV